MSPQLENGYTRIANDLLAVLSCAKMTDYERVVIFTVIRKTYGWGKKSDWISHGQFTKVTGVPRSRVCNTVTNLTERNILFRDGRKVGLQKDWSKWSIEWRINPSEVLPHQVTGVTSPGNKSVTSPGTHKRNKETIQKKFTEQGSDKEIMFNKKSEDYLEGDIDLDGDGTISNPEAKQRAEDKELNARFRAAVDWLIEHQGRDRKRTSVPKQLKAIKKLYTMGVSANEAKQVILESEGSPIWQGRAEKPDYWTAVAIIQKRG